MIKPCESLSRRPIGKTFSGNLDGLGHTIHDVNISGGSGTSAILASNSGNISNNIGGEIRANSNNGDIFINSIIDTISDNQNSGSIQGNIGTNIDNVGFAVPIITFNKINIKDQIYIQLKIKNI